MLLELGHNSFGGNLNVANVYQFPVKPIIPKNGDAVKAAKMHTKEFHNIPILMWKTGHCTDFRCGVQATYAVHFSVGDSLPYCPIHLQKVMREFPPYSPEVDRVLGALPIETDRFPHFGAVPHPPHLIYPIGGKPRLETPDEWRKRLAMEGLPIPEPGIWEVSGHGVY